MSPEGLAQVLLVFLARRLPCEPTLLRALAAEFAVAQKLNSDDLRACICAIPDQGLRVALGGMPDEPEPWSSSAGMGGGAAPACAWNGFAYADPATAAVVAQAKRIAPSDVAVHITGETGTGKEVLASALHQGSSQATGPFVALNAAAYPEGLVASAFFGHARGAFTGAFNEQQGALAQAHGGTLFLDEIGDMPQCVQVMLLRALQDHCVTRLGDHKVVQADFRLVTATHRDLRREVEAGRFREDLYYRVNGISIILPPLRERRADIPVLAAVLLRRVVGPAAHAGLITPEVQRLLREHPWHGNVRELENAIKRGYALSAADGRSIRPEDLQLDSARAPQSSSDVVRRRPIVEGRGERRRGPAPKALDIAELRRGGGASSWSQAPRPLPLGLGPGPRLCLVHRRACKATALCGPIHD